MIGIALRFSDNFAPENGTIVEHQKLIDKNGYVYFGKMGTPISDKNIKNILKQENPRILLIESGMAGRYWAWIDEIIKTQPPLSDFPDYYHDKASRFRTWFKIRRIEKAPSNIMSFCKVVSSGTILSEASKYSMSPFFIIEY